MKKPILCAICGLDATHGQIVMRRIKSDTAHSKWKPIHEVGCKEIVLPVAIPLGVVPPRDDRQ